MKIRSNRISAQLYQTESGLFCSYHYYHYYYYEKVDTASCTKSSAESGTETRTKIGAQISTQISTQINAEKYKQDSVQAAVIYLFFYDMYCTTAETLIHYSTLIMQDSKLLSNKLMQYSINILSYIFAAACFLQHNACDRASGESNGSVVS